MLIHQIINTGGSLVLLETSTDDTELVSTQIVISAHSTESISHLSSDFNPDIIKIWAESLSRAFKLVIKTARPPQNQLSSFMR